MQGRLLIYSSPAARHQGSFDVTVNLLGRSRDIATEVVKRNGEILERLETIYIFDGLTSLIPSYLAFSR
jgi:hypothetical protein